MIAGAHSFSECAVRSLWPIQNGLAHDGTSTFKSQFLSRAICVVVIPVGAIAFALDIPLAIILALGALLGSVRCEE